MKPLTITAIIVLSAFSTATSLTADLVNPNILLILADDLGFGDVGIYNSESKVPTPHLDRLAAEGMLFTDAHSPSTVCTPTRYSLMTGRMLFRKGFPGVFTGVEGPCLIEKDRFTLPQMLREQGYTTAMFGKWHIGMTFSTVEGKPVYEVKFPKSDYTRSSRAPGEGVARVSLTDFSKPISDGPLHRGFDQFFGTACCPTTDWLYAYIDGDRIPVPPTKLLDREAAGLPKHPYSRDNRLGMIAPGFDLEEVDLVFLEKSKAFLQNHVKESPGKPFFLFHSTQAVHLPSFPGKNFKGRTQAGPHGDFIFELDYIVGDLMKMLDELGIADNTLIIFTSDNGPEVTSVINMRGDYGHDGARPWRGMKRDQWEGGHRVPFIARWPGKIKAGSTSDQTICLTDIMSTCAAITGYEMPDNAAEDSFNILPALTGESQGEAIRPYTLHQTIRLDLAIRRGKWKYLDHKGSGGNNYQARRGLTVFSLPEKAPGAPGQLYDLENDPGETTNLYYDHPEIAKELKALLDTSIANGRSRS